MLLHVIYSTDVLCDSFQQDLYRQIQSNFMNLLTKYMTAFTVMLECEFVLKARFLQICFLYCASY